MERGRDLRRGWSETPPPGRSSIRGCFAPGRRSDHSGGEATLSRSPPDRKSTPVRIPSVQDDGIALVQAEQLRGASAIDGDGDEAGGVLDRDALTLRGCVEGRNRRKQHVADTESPIEARLLKHRGPHVELHVPEAVAPGDDAVDPPAPNAGSREGDPCEPVRGRLGAEVREGPS